MKANNYQFSFTIASPPQPNHNVLTLLLKDIFPYLQLQSATSVLQLLSLVPFIIQLLNSSLVPLDKSSLTNTFQVILGYSVKSAIYLRLGSEYEQRLGFSHFIAITFIIVFSQCIIQLTLGICSWEAAFNGGGSLSLFILSMIDLNRFKQNDLVEFETEEKVQNYDLLDLNDTIVRLKTRDSTFTYDSYTNREFYFHNLTPSSSKSKPKPKKKKTINSISQLIDDPSNSPSQQLLETKLFKAILFHFVIFANLTLQEFSIIILIEGLLYLTLANRLLKKVIT